MSTSSSFLIKNHLHFGLVVHVVLEWLTSGMAVILLCFQFHVVITPKFALVILSERGNFVPFLGFVSVTT